MLRLGWHLNQEEVLGAEVGYTSAAVERLDEGLKGLRGDVWEDEDVAGVAVVKAPPQDCWESGQIGAARKLAAGSPWARPPEDGAGETAEGGLAAG